MEIFENAKETSAVKVPRGYVFFCVCAKIKHLLPNSTREPNNYTRINDSSDYVCELM